MGKKKSNKEKQIKRLEKDIEEWLALFKRKSEEGFFSLKNIGWLFLDLLIGISLMATIVFIASFIPRLIATFLGVLVALWYLGLPIIPSFSNKYSLYNWKSGQLELDNKLLEIKLKLKALYG